jgi:hypothetical protein
MLTCLAVALVVVLALVDEVYTQNAIAKEPKR